MAPLPSVPEVIHPGPNARARPIQRGRSGQHPSPPAREASSAGWLGASLLADREGVRVRRVAAGSPAERAGLRAGDLLVRIDGRVGCDPEAVLARIRLLRPGDDLAVVLRRAGSDHLLRVTLDAAPTRAERVELALVGRPAPPLGGVELVQGPRIPDPTTRGDRLLLLHFRAPWCIPCRIVTPWLERLWRTHGHQGLEVAGIVTEPADRAARDARALGIESTVLADPEGEVSRQYGAKELPELVLVDRQGKVRAVVIGWSEAGQKRLEVLIEQLLSEP